MMAVRVVMVVMVAELTTNDYGDTLNSLSPPTILVISNLDPKPSNKCEA